MKSQWVSYLTFFSTSVMCSITLLAEDHPDYLTQLKPLLRERCYACHGALKQESELRLDTAALMIQGGASGAAIVPGDPESSLLFQRVAASDISERMPPEHEAEPLSADQIDVLRRWIVAGAPAPDDESPQSDPQHHWSFQPVVRPAVPVVDNPLWSENPIDAFIARQHQQQALVPQQEADKRIWLRRVSLDLIGLPPTPEELDAFVADQSAGAYETVVMRLLDSPQHGQRWGRHWMDIWRYSDWWGLGAEVRNSQKHIWHWRDWVIDSINDDRGYDQMLREMLAADELYPNDLDRLSATGYLARQYFIFNRTSWLDETIEHTAKAMLGLTFNCAKCHDHKYDPLTHVEYYRLRAIFEPYQVRMEMVPGVSDFASGGIPRAYDANLDAETYLHLRGDDRHPDKSRVLEPGVPAFLTSDELRFEVQPVELPVEAAHPELRPFVVAAHRAAAIRSVDAARSALKTAQTQLTQSEAVTQQRIAHGESSESLVRTELTSASSSTTTTAVGELLFRDDFSSEQPDVWERLTGQWSYENGRLHQHQTGASRTAIRLQQRPPDDFEARLKFIPVGGVRWKSVGISCDVAPDGNELLAFVSALASGPKVQVAYRKNGSYVYPPDAAAARDVELHREHELLLRVRGSLLNVLVDGVHAIAYRLPEGLPRQSGFLELMTFDAAAEFLEIEVRSLPPEVALIQAGRGTTTSVDAASSISLEEAQLACVIAEKAVVVAEARAASVDARAAADQARFVPSDGVSVEELCRLAARSEKLLNVAIAEELLSQSELAQLRAAEDGKDAAEKKRAEAETALQQAREKLEMTDGAYTPLPGALKTKEHYQDPNEPHPFPTTSSGRRTAFARWLTDPNNPLPARVAVNHIWTRHMGRPLVPSVFDFGLNGKPPTHPELLDWLAAELVEHNWSMKHLHRLITTSRTYRLSSSSSDVDADTISADSDNRFYWRMNPIRMEAEIVRDSLLHLAGELDVSLGGPPIPVDQDSRRRSLYFVHSHNEHQQFLSMFDNADVLQCYRRSESIVPQQALALENSPFVATMSERVAERIVDESRSASDEQFIRAAFLRVLADEPSEAELALVAGTLPRLIAAARTQKHPQPEQRARVAVIHALLNHNDFLTIR